MEKVAFLTQHGKEQIVAAILAEGGMKVERVEGFNTDLWGTFSGEIERPASQAETAVMKAKKALELCDDASWGLGSEGAFNPHPASPFITLNTEVLALCGRSGKITIRGRAAGTNVVFHSRTIRHANDLITLASDQNFPEYGLILKVVQAGKVIASEKECQTVDELKLAWQHLNKIYPDEAIIAETDLRAHRNPARRLLIAEAARDLLQRWRTVCANCGLRGFGKEESIPGLPCSVCYFPTRLPKGYVWRCPHCGYEETRRNSDSPETADPSVCSVCNP
jgi:hypothetical protein